MFVSSGCPVVFLQSMAVWCVCVGASRVAEEHSGLSSEIHACPLLFSQAERPQGQSLPLRHWALTCTHITNPLLYFQPAARSVALLFSEAWCSVHREGILWVYGLKAPKPSAAGSSFLVCPSQLSCFRYTLKIHMMHRDSVDFLRVSAGLGLVLLAHQEPWVNRGGEASPKSSLRTGTTLLGELFSDTSSQWWWWVYSSRDQKTNSENISLSPVSP